MRSSLIIIAIALLLTSCGQSTEDKANKAIAEYLQDALSVPESYQPISSKLDTAYVEYATDQRSLELVMEFSDLITKVQEYMDEVEEQQRQMELNSMGRGYSAYIRGEYDRAKKKRDQTQNMVEMATNKMTAKYQELKDQQASLNIGEVKGWKVEHKFKSENRLGNTLTDTRVFILSPEFEVIQSYKPDEYNTARKFMEFIASSTDISELAGLSLEF